MKRFLGCTLVIVFLLGFSTMCFTLPRNETVEDDSQTTRFGLRSSQYFRDLVSAIKYFCDSEQELLIAPLVDKDKLNIACLFNIAFALSLNEHCQANLHLSNLQKCHYNETEPIKLCANGLCDYILKAIAEISRICPDY